MDDTAPGNGRLRDKVAIVTGASSGIGRAIALAYAEEGAKVVCADISPTARPEVVAETSSSTIELLRAKYGEDRAIAVKTDVSRAQDVEHLVEETTEHFGRLDILVNNAAVTLPHQRIHELDDDKWETVMAVNARSVFLTCKAAITRMLKQEPHSSGDRGWIINLASVACVVGYPKVGAYTASKSAVFGLTRQIAVDYASDRIHCNAICPGLTNTAILQKNIERSGDHSDVWNAAHPFRGVGQVSDLVGPAVFLASDDARWVTGHHLVVDGGYSAR